MRVATVAGFTAYWGNDLTPDVLEQRGRNKKTVGGGEEAVLETAAGLVKRGHEVDLWWYGQPGNWRGVRFYGPGDDLYGKLAREPYDVVIGWSTVKVLEVAKRVHGDKVTTLFAQQLNDLWCLGDWSYVDAVVSPSFSHAQQLWGWGWKGKPFAVVHNALHPQRHAKQTPWEKRPLDVGYWSSPDRGLHSLLRAWPEVKKREPEARLHVFYEIQRLLDMSQPVPGPLGHRIRELAKLVPVAMTDPSIIFHGAVPRDDLAVVQNNCRVMAYPYQPVFYCEGFGGAVNQGIAAGCRVLLTPHDAFPTVYEDSHIDWLPKDSFEMERVLPDRIVKALHTPPVTDPAPLFYDWDAVTREMEAAFDKSTWEKTHAP